MIQPLCSQERHRNGCPKLMYKFFLAREIPALILVARRETHLHVVSVHASNLVLLKTMHTIVERLLVHWKTDYVQTNGTTRLIFGHEQYRHSDGFLPKDDSHLLW